MTDRALPVLRRGEVSQQSDVRGSGQRAGFANEDTTPPYVVVSLSVTRSDRRAAPNAIGVKVRFSEMMKLERVGSPP